MNNNLTMKLLIIIILLFIGLAEQRNIARHRLIRSPEAKKIAIEVSPLENHFRQQRKLAAHNRKRRSIRQDKCKEITITECMIIEGTDKKFCNTYQSVEC